MSAFVDLVRHARDQAIEVTLSDFLNKGDASVAWFCREAPDWLREQLACEGVQIYRERNGAWILAPLDE